jgi:hypothetical protein
MHEAVGAGRNHVLNYRLISLSWNCQGVAGLSRSRIPKTPRQACSLRSGNLERPRPARHGQYAGLPEVAEEAFADLLRKHGHAGPRGCGAHGVQGRRRCRSYSVTLLPARWADAAPHRLERCSGLIRPHGETAGEKRMLSRAKRHSSDHLQRRSSTAVRSTPFGSNAFFEIGMPGGRRRLPAVGPVPVCTPVGLVTTQPPFGLLLNAAQSTCTDAILAFMSV